MHSSHILQHSQYSMYFYLVSFLSALVVARFVYTLADTHMLLNTRRNQIIDFFFFLPYNSEHDDIEDVGGEIMHSLFIVDCEFRGSCLGNGYAHLPRPGRAVSTCQRGGLCCGTLTWLVWRSRAGCACQGLRADGRGRIYFRLVLVLDS
jgi:hypothetical protein